MWAHFDHVYGEHNVSPPPPTNSVQNSALDSIFQRSVFATEHAVNNVYLKNSIAEISSDETRLIEQPNLHFLN